MEQNKTQEMRETVSDGGVFSSGMATLVKSLKAVFILLAAVIALLLIWFFTFSGFFTVKPDTEVITLRFGELKDIYKEDWHWVFPYPVSSIIVVPTSPITITTNAFMPANQALITDRKNAGPGAAAGTLKPGVDGYLITADACLIHTAWSMTYRIRDAKRYFEQCMTPVNPGDPDMVIQGAGGENLGTRGPRTLLRAVLDNAVIRVTSEWNANDIIFLGKAFQYGKDVESLVRSEVAKLDIGIEVISVNLTVKSPPPQTIDAFDEVLQSEIQASAAEKTAETYRENQLALAKSEADAMIADAGNYKLKIVSDIKADADYFKDIYAEYKKNPASVTVSLFSRSVADAMAQVRDKFILNALPAGRQELRLKLNPEPESAQEKKAESGKAKEAAK